MHTGVHHLFGSYFLKPIQCDNKHKRVNTKRLNTTLYTNDKFRYNTIGTRNNKYLCAFSFISSRHHTVLQCVKFLPYMTCTATTHYSCR